MVLEDNKGDFNELYRQLKEGAEIEVQEKIRKSEEEWEAYRQENIQKSEESQKALDNLCEAFVRNEQQKEADKLEELRAKKMLDLEEELEREAGVPSQKTKKLNDSLNSMLNNIF